MKGKLNMPLIKHDIFIDAPINVCFDLARNVDVHIETTSKTKEKAIDGVIVGLMENGDTVTWEATHLGVKQKLTAKIIEMEKPYKFTDVMVKGAFHSFTHTHEFIEDVLNCVKMKRKFLYSEANRYITCSCLTRRKCILQKSIMNLKEILSSQM